MSTTNPTPQLRPLTPKDMEEYEKELKASLANKDATDDEATPTLADPSEPTPPAKVEISAEELEELKSYKKRFGDSTRYVNELLDKVKQAEKAKEEALKQSTKKPFASDEEVQDFENKVETSHILKELIRRQNEEAQAEIRKEFETREKEREAAAIKQAEDSAKLSKAHPDWPDYNKGGELHDIFIGWLDEQPATIQRLANYTETKDIDGTISVLKMFKAEVQVKKKSTGLNKKPASTNPASRTPVDVPKPSEGAFDVMAWDKAFDAALKTNNKKLQDKLMEDMQKARREGRLTNY